VLSNASELAKKIGNKKGYPNESDIIFDNNKAFAIVKRDADSYSAQLSHSTFPFKKRRWTDLKRYIGGPVMLRLDKNFSLVAGRIIKHGQLVTGLLKMNLLNGNLQELLILPSTGDHGYLGLVLKKTGFMPAIIHLMKIIKVMCI
jgi:hypothetical protein|tara:strand:+ start:553 stop:987 length:435 start_codon:yes stop_codon:yes gene_type:complete